MTCYLVSASTYYSTGHKSSDPRATSTRAVVYKHLQYCRAIYTVCLHNAIRWPLWARLLYGFLFSSLHLWLCQLFCFLSYPDLVICRVFGYIMCRCGCAQIINLISSPFLKDAMDHSMRQQTSLRG